MRTEGRIRGMRFPDNDPYFESVSFRRGKEDNHNKRVDQLQDLFNRIIDNEFGGNKEDSLIICIVPPKPNDAYSQVKQAAERHDRVGVLTQCVQDKNFDKSDRSVIRNILLKINAKMGGRNHVPLYPEPKLVNVSILRIPTLIIGIDVNHPSLPIQGNSHFCYSLIRTQF